MHIHPDALAHVEQTRALRWDEITLAALRDDLLDVAQSTRRRCSSTSTPARLTLRVGDVRKLRRPR
jgi:hypothetical protein